MAIVLVLVGCSAPVPPLPSAPVFTTAPEEQPGASAGPDRLTGEVVFDGGWPSEHREGCLSLQTDDGFVELVSAESWFLTHDAKTGWFVIRDDADNVLMQEHRLATVTGSFLTAPGCREGTLFDVTGFEPPPETAATLWVEVVGGIGATEGSVNVVRVLDEERGPLFQQPVGPGESMAVPSGSMILFVFQKICDGNCVMAYGVMADCEIPLEIESDSQMTLTVLLSSEPPHCELLLREGKPATACGGAPRSCGES